MSTNRCKKMSYPARKLVIRAASSLILGLVLAGCQGGGGSDSGSEGSEADRSSNQDSTQETASVKPDSAVLSWDAPGYRVNGVGLPDGQISHYVVLWGQDPEQLNNSTEVTCKDCQDMEYTVEDLNEGKWYFSVKTVDSEGRESVRAEPASKTI